MKGYKYLQNVATLHVDRETCIGCGICQEVCPHHVLAIKDKRAEIIDFNSCMECGACARNCPVAAIAVDFGVGCARSLVHEWLLSFRPVKKIAGGC